MDSMEEDSEQESEDFDEHGEFQDMMETSGLQAGDEIEQYRKKKVQNKMNAKLKKNKDRFKKDDKHSKRKKVK